MKIKKSAWHYKIRNLGNDWSMEDDTLCRYFWAFMFKGAFLVGLTLVISITLFAYITGGFFMPITIMGLFIISCVALPILAIYYLRRWLGHAPELPQENILIAYAKAKKRKICPLIEYIE